MKEKPLNRNLIYPVLITTFVIALLYLKGISSSTSNNAFISAENKTAGKKIYSLKKTTRSDSKIYPAEACTAKQVFSFVSEYEALNSDPRLETVLDASFQLRSNEKIWLNATSGVQQKMASSPYLIRDKNGEKFRDKYHSALIAYSLGEYNEDNLYVEFNEGCRAVCKGQKKFEELSNLFMFFLLYDVMESQEAQEDIQDMYLYRGSYNTLWTLEPSTLVGFGQFLSTTSRRYIAENFAGTGNHGVLFIIKDLENLKGKFINMIGYTSYAHEKEYLLSPFQIFEVVSVEKGKRLTEVTLRTLNVWT